MIKRLWNKWFGQKDSVLDKYYSKDDQETIKSLLDTHHKYKKETDDIINQMTDNSLELLAEIQDLNEQLKIHNKHQSLETFKKFLDAMVPPKRKTYDFRGRGREATHLSLADYTPLVMQTFIEDVMKFEFKQYQKPDNMIYAFVREFHRKFPNNVYYGSDMKNFGVADYWESPNEAIKRFSSKKSADCDAHGSALYGTLRYMLEQKFPDELWRLRVFVVGTIDGSGHYILSWIKEGPNDWIPLETTWYKDSIKKAWNKNLTLRTQIMYDVWWSFDDKYEYSKL